MTHDDEQNDTNDDKFPSQLPVTRRSILVSGTLGATTSLAGCINWAPQSGGVGSTAQIDDERIREVGLQAREAVVRVDSGTGWVTQDDLVLTCSHVVSGETVDLKFFDGRTADGEVLDRHETLDLALIAASTGDIDPLTLDTERPLDDSAAMTLIQIGHPKAVGSWVMSAGTFVQPSGDGFLADVPCGPGSSGSPLLTMDGTVVGIATGTTVVTEQQAHEDRPETVYGEFPGQRLLARAVGPEAIDDCLEHFL